MKLNSKLDLARRVLQLSEFCRKMETIQELVLPFDVPVNENIVKDETKKKKNIDDDNIKGDDLENQDIVDEEEDENDVDALLEQKVVDKHLSQDNGIATVLPPNYQSTVWNDENNVYVPPAERLAKFYRIYNKVLLDNIAIDKERSRLVEENAQLEDLISQYLDGLTLNQRVLEDSNPLFVVNGR